ncbi:hypothetical protein PORY_002594 [Pneumocystis oryctolagi]|uniref:Uncharacterized protein n=1 Tax=Pneumocystis oryctolagi TaxID=42067 RepID=A0ACB7C951_9ASCO|nr:hypothetical protein PORY_002594 [Pneumocystis oryctolagi]
MIYCSKRSVSLGELYRYIITLDSSFDDFQKKSKIPFKTLWLRVKNTTSHLFRVAYFNGPYTLYVSVRSLDYSPFKPSVEFIPQYRQNLSAGSSFCVSLPVSNNSNNSLKTECSSEKKGWVVDIISQVVFSQSAKVHFEIALSTSMQNILWAGRFGTTEFIDIPINILEQSTDQLWSIPLNLKPESSSDKSLRKDIHFVVLTHGLHSNVNADLFYLKERIEQQGRESGENLVISGYNGNVCKTDKGIEYLGKRLGEWVLKEVGWSKNEKPYYQKISFISHSLGGLVQLYAIGWIWLRTEGKFYDSSSNGLVPVNFVTLASPWLGLFAENPSYITKALEYGIVGKTGKDLGLFIKHKSNQKSQTDKSDDSTPLLEILSSEKGPYRKALKLFKKRTVYSNIINDGIVPLRTSSLLFLDWKNIDWSEKRNLNEYQTNTVLSSCEEKIDKNHSYEQKSNSVDASYSSQIPSEIYSDESIQTNATSFSLVLPSIEKPQFLNIDKYSNSKIYNLSSNIFENAKFENGESMKFDINNSYIQEYNGSLFGSKLEKANVLPSCPDHEFSRTSIYYNCNSSELFKNDFYSDFSRKNRVRANSQSFISSFKAYFKMKHDEDFLKIKKNKKSQTINSTSTDYTYFCYKINLIPKMGFLRSARNVLTSPLPQKEYLINPLQTRTIIHDRYYYPEDIPKRFYKLNSKLDTSQNKKNDLKNKVSKEKLILEEKIAREWHADMVWRKVLVHLEPDAHNNIICRRMFVNAYGWPVIEHLVLNHF